MLRSCRQANKRRRVRQVQSALRHRRRSVAERTATALAPAIGLTVNRARARVKVAGRDADKAEIAYYERRRWDTVIRAAISKLPKGDYRLDFRATIGGELTALPDERYIIVEVI